MTKNKWGFVLSLFTISILMFGNPTSADTSNLDYSSIGVNEGDTFVYTLDKLFVTDDAEDRAPLDFDTDGNPDMYLREGDLFTMTVVNTTISTRDVFDGFVDHYDQNTIEVSFSQNGNSVTAYSVVDAGHWVSLTDWVNLIPHFEELFKESEDEGDTLGVTSSHSITETDDLVEIDSYASASEGGISVKLESEVILNKTTGVKVYSRAYVEVKSGSDRIETEIILSLIDFNKSDSDSGFLPAFESTLAIIALSSIITIIHKKRKNFQV